jgi:excisionase family DNA binding protein
MPIEYSLIGSPAIPEPTADEARLYQESSRKLEPLLSNGSVDIHLLVQPANEPEQTIPIPLSAARMLSHILTQMAQGNGVTLIPMHAELTTHEAAKAIKVSRPFLIGLLEKGEIPFRLVGTHRRILFRDLMAYKEKTQHGRSEALAELSAVDQALGLR